MALSHTEQRSDIRPAMDSQSQFQMMKGKKPDRLAKSISVDDEDLDETTSMEAESFLESYEEMLRLQQDEMTVTLRHLEPLLEILERKADCSNHIAHGARPFTREFTYSSLKSALAELEEDDSLRFVSSDLQWKLVLELLTENDVAGHEKISWAEIVMCYRTCIIGMQALDQTNEQNALRARIRQRSLHMLASFRPDSSKLRSSEVSTHVEKQGRRIALEWFDALFMCGALLLLGTVAISTFDSPWHVGSNTVSRVTDLFHPPLIPGPHVAPFSTTAQVIPGPHALPYVEAYLIPGPTVRPFFISGDATGILVPEENTQRKTSPPASITGRGESRISHKPTRMGGPLQSKRMSLKHGKTVQETLATQEPDKFRYAAAGSKKKSAFKNNLLAIATVVSGTVAAGAISTMFSSLSTTVAAASFPGLLPVGATVVFSTLLAHGIRDWVSSIISKLQKAYAT